MLVGIAYAFLYQELSSSFTSYFPQPHKSCYFKNAEINDTEKTNDTEKRIHFLGGLLVVSLLYDVLSLEHCLTWVNDV